MVTYKVEEEIAVLSDNGTASKRLTVTAWNGNPGKLDLRTWRVVDGEKQPGKGLTLTEDEAEILYHALSVYFKGV